MLRKHPALERNDPEKVLADLHWLAFLLTGSREIATVRLRNLPVDELEIAARLGYLSHPRTFGSTLVVAIMPPMHLKSQSVLSR